jgi:hypothetical protein
VIFYHVRDICGYLVLDWVFLSGNINTCVNVKFKTSQSLMGILGHSDPACVD